MKELFNNYNFKHKTIDRLITPLCVRSVFDTVKNRTDRPTEPTSSQELGYDDASANDSRNDLMDKVRVEESEWLSGGMGEICRKIDIVITEMNCIGKSWNSWARKRNGDCYWGRRWRLEMMQWTTKLSLIRSRWPQEFSYSSGQKHESKLQNITKNDIELDGVAKKWSKRHTKCSIKSQSRSFNSIWFDLVIAVLFLNGVRCICW